MIFGKPGSGKSTFAVNVAKNFDFPVYHIDQYFFTNHWKERDKHEFLSILQSQISQNQWIIDGNALTYLSIRYQKCDLAIYFDLPFCKCLWGVFKRRIFPNKKINDRAPQCPERVSWNLLKYLWNFNKRADQILARLKKNYPNVLLIVVRNRSDLKWLWGE